MADVKDVTLILSQEAIDAYRRAYRTPDPSIGASTANLDPGDTLMGKVASKVLIQKYPASQTYIEAMNKSLFHQPANEPPTLADLSPREREIALIAILSSQRAKLELAIHIYWGLMENLDPPHLAALLMASGMYAGISVQSSGLDVMQATMQALEDHYRESSTEHEGALDIETVLFEVLLAEFS